MSGKELFPHQVEAVDAVLRALQTPADGHMPAEGLRTQVIAATGSGKTLIATAAAQKLGARRVLVLVPTLDLLTQTAAAWREGGRTGPMLGVCRLRPEDSDGMPCTTDPVELVEWTRGLDRVTVFATYAAVGRRVLQRAHAQDLAVWDLMVVDEAHRTSGDAGRPWAAVHDQTKIPAARRLYMTATPRIWEAAEGSRDGAPRLVASMDPDSPIYGPVAFKLGLPEAISRGLIAPYQVVCVDNCLSQEPAVRCASSTIMRSKTGAVNTECPDSSMRGSESSVTNTVAFLWRVSQYAKYSPEPVDTAPASASSGCLSARSEETAISGSVQPSARATWAHWPIRSRDGTAMRRWSAFKASAVRSAISVLPVPHAETMCPRLPGFLRCRTPLSTACC